MISGLLRPSLQLVLLGTGLSLRHAPLTDDDRTFWGVSTLWGQVPRLDCVVEAHPEAIARELGRVDQVASITAPMFTADVWPSAPTARPFPLDQVRARFTARGRVKPPLGSSLDWLLALAVLHEPLPREIAIFGFDLQTDSEYATQLHTGGFWIGVAAGLGIAVTLTPTSALLNVPFLYGVEDRELRAAEAQVKERHSFSQLKHDRRLFEISNALARVPLISADRQRAAIQLARQALDECMFLRGAIAETAFQLHRLRH